MFRPNGLRNMQQKSAICKDRGGLGRGDIESTAVEKKQQPQRMRVGKKGITSPLY